MSKEAGLASLYRDQATDWTVESSLFDSRKEKDVSLPQCPELVPSILVVLSPGLRRPAREV